MLSTSLKKIKKQVYTALVLSTLSIACEVLPQQEDLFERPRSFDNRFARSMCRTSIKSSQVNTLPKAKSQAKDKRAKDRQKYPALRFKVGVAPPGFEVRGGV